MDNYFDRSELSHSDLMLINKSIEHYLNKKSMPKTKPMGVGSAFHCYKSEREKFFDEFIVKPEDLSFNTIEGMLWKEFNRIERYENRELIQLVMKNWFNPQKFDELYIAKPDDIKLNTADGKKWKSEHENFTIISEKDLGIVKSFKLEKSVLVNYLSHYDNKSFEYVQEDRQYEYVNANKTIISYDEFEWIKIVVDKILNHPLAYLFEGVNTEVEKEIYFDYDGLKCRGKLDERNNDRKLIFEYKSIDDCSKAENKLRYDYCSQGYFYQLGTYKETNEIYDVIFVFAEKAFPYGIKFIKASTETLNRGAEKVNSAIDKYKLYRTGTDLGYEEYIGYSDKLIEV